MRTVFVGTSDFAVPVLERLTASPHRPELVVTRPASRRGRGRKPAEPPIAEAAALLGLPLDQPPSINDEAARARIAAARPDAVCVSAYGALIREPLLSDDLLLNVHPSLLPRWRGAAPIERAIMAGDECTGVSIMRLTAGLDSGPVCAESVEPIGPDDTYGSLAPTLARLGGELLVTTLDAGAAGLRCDEQDDSAATYAEKISAEDRRLDPSEPAVELERRVRALAPHIGAWVELEDGERLGVAQARALPDDVGPPGRLVPRGEREVPTLACGRGALELLSVKPPGGREMTGEEWARGHLR